MRKYKKIKTDMENLRFLHRLNKFYNSPKVIHGVRYYPNHQSIKNNYNNNTRTIYLQKSTPISFYPVKIKIFKKGQNDYSYSPESNNNYSPSRSGNNNISFENKSLNKDRNNLARNYSKNRNLSDINSYENINYNKNIRQINYLKNSLGNPKQAKNLIINNNERKNRFITISPIHNSNKDYDYLRYNDINFYDNNYDNNNHKIRYLLSKNYINKIGGFKKFKNKKYYSNGYKLNNKDYRSCSYKYFPKNSEKYYANKYNMETSPGVKSNITDIYQNLQKKGGRKLFNSIKNKNETPNITPIANNNTPYINPQDNIIEEEMQLNNYNNLNKNPNNIFLNNNNNYYYNIVEIKLDDLIFIEGRLNDIILALNNNKNIYSIGAINESVEFFIFYFHSSLKNKILLFFAEQNRLVIKSAFNLHLFIIMLTYHLSLNPSMLVKVIILLKQIYNLLKMNLFLFMRKIELYYGDDFCSKNEIFFKACDYFLNENGLDNFNEGEIINLVNKNCVSMVNDLNNILSYYQQINNGYYNDFRNIYLNISRIDEQEIHNFFYSCLFCLKYHFYIFYLRLQ